MNKKTIAETLFERFSNVAATPDEQLAEVALDGFGLTPASSAAFTASMRTAAPTITPALTIGSLNRVRENLMRAVEEDKAIAAGIAERVANAMRLKGFHPEKGALLIVPAKYANRLPLFYLPPYVRFSAFAEQIYMVANPTNFGNPTVTAP